MWSLCDRIRRHGRFGKRIAQRIGRVPQALPRCVAPTASLVLLALNIRTQADFVAHSNRIAAVYHSRTAAPGAAAFPQLDVQ